MRWDGLFTDLQAQAEALAAAERGAEIEDRTRYETGQLSLLDRLRPAIGSQVRVRCLAGLSVDGTLRRAHPDWLLLDEPVGREALVVCAAICAISGLGRAAAPVPEAPTGLVQARLGLRYALRLIARDRSGLQLSLRDGSVLTGTLDRVGADFVEVALHAAGEPRRHREVTEVLSVPFGAIVALHRDG